MRLGQSIVLWGLHSNKQPVTQISAVDMMRLELSEVGTEYMFMKVL